MRKSRAAAKILIPVLLMGVVIAIGVGLWFIRKQSNNPAAGKETKNPINVVIYLIDTLRADHVGAYGSSDARTPNIDKLANSGVLFEQHTSAAPWTLPSITALHTSLPPCEHGVLVDGRRISKKIQTMAERFQGLGFQTASYFENPYAGTTGGLQAGFDIAKLIRVRTALDIAPWFKEMTPQPFFLYLHTMEVHDPYQAPKKFIEAFGSIPKSLRQSLSRAARRYRDLTKVDFDAKQKLGATDNTDEQTAALRILIDGRDVYGALYKGGVSWADDNLGKVIQQLKDRNLWENTLFILSADHGEEMGEHGGWQHDQSVYQELIHTPLIIKFPGNEFAGKRITQNVTTIDVLPTLFDYLGKPEAVGTVRGRSLMTLIRTGADSAFSGPRFVSTRHNFKKYYKPWKEQRGDINLVVRDEHWKAIWNVEPDTLELYDLSVDPGEKKNLAATQKDRADALREFARKRYSECMTTLIQAEHIDLDKLDTDSRDILQQIGYLGTSDEKEEVEPVESP